jgi:hypothetical protein
VVGSLWPVADALTCALIARFYELWRGDELEPAQALRKAQQWVRDTTISDRAGEIPEVDWGLSWGAATLGRHASPRASFGLGRLPVCRGVIGRRAAPVVLHFLGLLADSELIWGG